MSAAHWPQVPRRIGLGAGLLDFEAYASSDPNFAAAWGEINTQLAAEGADISQVNNAKTAFVNSLEQMASNAIGVTGDEAIQSAKSYVLLGQTLAGAAQTIQGLVQTAETGSIPEIMSAFTGTLVGLAVTAGAFSAGIGAAIVGAVGGLINILQAAGFFGAPSTDVEIASCGYYPYRPAYMIGCVGVNPVSGAVVQVSPGSPLWRSFPDKRNNVNPPPGHATSDNYSYSDAQVWFQTRDQGGGGGLWKGCRWNGPGTVDHPTSGNVRLVDIAFPNYAAVEGYENSSGELNRAYVAAWKANQEYALNGLRQPGSDAQVLITLIRLWNRSHGGPTWVLEQQNIADGGDYLSSLVTAAVSLLGNDPIRSGSGLVINTGPIIQPKRTISFRVHLANDSATAPSPPMSTGAKVAVGGAAVGAAALLGTAAFALAKGQAVDVVLKHAWGHVKGWFRK
jgi:hypothetical protein